METLEISMAVVYFVVGTIHYVIAIRNNLGR